MEEERTAEPPPLPRAPTPPPNPPPRTASAWDDPDPTPDQIAGWEAAAARTRLPGSPGWDARLKLMAWREELARRASESDPPLTPVVAPVVAHVPARAAPVAGTAAGPSEPARAAPAASQGLSGVAPGVGTEDLLRRLISPRATGDDVVTAAKRLVDVHVDEKSYRGYLAVCREVLEGELALRHVIAAFRQAAKPKVENRGAIFMDALREHRARKDRPRVLLSTACLGGRSNDRLGRKLSRQDDRGQPIGETR